MAKNAIFSRFATISGNSGVLLEGSNSVSVDAKGRIAIPVEYREALMEAAQGKLHITWHFKESCLLVFPETEWLKFRSMVAGWPQSVAWQKRMVLNNAKAYTLDDSFRVLLTAELREAAHIEKGTEGWLVGNGTHFELWDKASYMAKVAGEREKPLSEYFDTLSF